MTDLAPKALLPMLAKLMNPAISQNQMLIISRHSQVLDKGLLDFGKSIANQEIFASDTMELCQIFLEAHMDELPLDMPEKWEKFTERILVMISLGTTRHARTLVYLHRRRY